MTKHSDYLSEFEQEFELDSELELEDSMDSNEYADNEWESDEEQEYESEYESEYEVEEEYEYDDSESEAWNYSPEQEYENRLYEVLTSGMNNEFEMEQEIDRVLYEMEQDFFWKKLKKMGTKFLKSAGGKMIKKLAQKSPFGTALGALSKVARGDIKGAFKGVLNNGLLKHAVGFLPGGSLVSKGMDIAGKYMNNETPAISKAQVGQAVQLAKSAYGQLANDMARVNHPEQLKSLGKAAVRKAMGGMRPSPMRGKNKTRIPLEPGSVVTVHPTHINIWKP